MTSKFQMQMMLGGRRGGKTAEKGADAETTEKPDTRAEPIANKVARAVKGMKKK